MTLLEAHGRFALMGDKSFLPELENDPHFPAVATALADASGWLDDCDTDDDLRAAAEQGETLYATEIVSADDIATAAHEVIMEVMRWCEQQGAMCSSDS